MKQLVLLTVSLILVACQGREDDAREVQVQTEERQTATVDPAREEQAIRQLVQRWIEAQESKDAEAIAGMFADDGVAFYSGEKLEGREAIRRDSEEFFALPNSAGTFEPERIVVSESGDLAYEVGSYSGSFDAPAGRVEQRGLYLTVWKKTPEGWRVAVDATSPRVERPETSED